jgi:hypothetical protein
MTFADTRRADQEDVPVLAHELTGGQLINLGAVDGWIEAEVEVLQGARFPEIG